eukprot:365976-Chlamydomonas_euryale.AAC.8
MPNRLLAPADIKTVRGRKVLDVGGGIKVVEVCVWGRLQTGSRVALAAQLNLARTAPMCKTSVLPCIYHM